MYDKSAKVLAFDKERCKYKKQIKELNYVIKRKNSDISDIMERACNAESKSEELHGWVERLLSYMDMSEDKMKKVFKTQKTISDSVELIAKLFSIPSKKLF